ncbi:MAG: heavy-metal-associated domain-containing protein [Syntrophobacterales bacterium]|jgi:copper chaperone CopZ|nr:heavy-metal-associated domain-containing protein [Syntrophobacterales bacterium]
MEPKVYRVQGMTCGGCAKHVEKALRSVPGVTGVVMDVANGTASVESTAPFESMAASVAAAGYEMISPA